MSSSYLDIYAELVAAIETLPGDQAKILQLYYVDSLNWKEICLVLGQDYVTVKIAYWKAMEALKPKLTFVQ